MTGGNYAYRRPCNESRNRNIVSQCESAFLCACGAAAGEKGAATLFSCLWYVEKLLMLSYNIEGLHVITHKGHFVTAYHHSARTASTAGSNRARGNIAKYQKYSTTVRGDEGNVPPGRHVRQRKACSGEAAVFCV